MSAQESAASCIIRAERRALAAVINTMKTMIGEIRAGRMKPDFRLFWGMVQYIDAFPERVRHPRKEDWRFDRIRQRTLLADALIAELGTQHRTGGPLDALRKCLGDFEAGIAGALEGLDAAIETYAEYSWAHVDLEALELLPRGEALLTDAD